MRKYLRRFLPDHETVRRNRWLAPFAGPLLHHRLWHLNRHSAAGALAVGLFCGLIPGPFQIAGAALASVALRLNLPLALLTTFYSNPLTIVPLYLAAFGLGRSGTGSCFFGIDADVQDRYRTGCQQWRRWWRRQQRSPC